MKLKKYNFKLLNTKRKLNKRRKSYYIEKIGVIVS